MSPTPSIAIFPYLKTFERVQYKDLLFRNIEDISNLPEEVARHLNCLSQMFFLRDHLLLKHITYAIIERVREDEPGDPVLLKELQEFQTVVAYLYSAPHSTLGNVFLTREHASLFLCSPKRFFLSLVNESQYTSAVGDVSYPKPDKRGEVDGYQVLLDFRSYLWVTEGSRVYPPAGRIWLNYSQDLYSDLSRFPPVSHQAQLLSFITAIPEKSLLSSRILTAIEWYNRSTSIDIEEDVALVYLAIAFECLLNLEQGKGVTARFQETVSLLLGGLPRLDSWLEQFYGARSQIVHKGRSANLMFLATDHPKSPSGRTPIYRSLVSVGRQIFQLCLGTIVNGALMADRLNLSAMLFTNQQRLEEICQILDTAKGSATEKLKAIAQHIHDVDNYRFVEETGLRLETLIGAAQLVVRTYLDTDPSDDSSLLTLLRDFSEARTRTDQYEALSKLEAIQERYEAEQATDKADIRSETFLLLDCVWHYTFMHYYWLKESRENGTS